MRRVAVGALVAAVMLLGSFQAPQRHVHTAIRARGHSCGQASITHPVFSLESSDGRDGESHVVVEVAKAVHWLATPPTDTVHLVPQARRAGFVPAPLRRLKLPPRSNDPSLSI